MQWQCTVYLRLQEMPIFDLREGIEDKRRRKSILQEIKKTHFNKSLASKIKWKKRGLSWKSNWIWNSEQNLMNEYRILLCAQH